MEQHSSTVATLRAAKGLAALSRGAAEVKPGAAMGGDMGPTLGVVPGHRLGRTATLAKGYRLMQPPAALPLFDVSVAVIDSLNLMRASIEEEVVMQSTLAVPAHQALACRIEAYGTPFAAPSLNSIVEGKLSSESDKQFAACLAAPPDFDAAPAGPEFSLQRMASLGALLRPQGGGAAPVAQAAHGQQEAQVEPAGALSRGSGAARSEELLRTPSVQVQKKAKKADWRGDLSPSDGRAEPDAAQGDQGAAAAAARPDVATRQGRAAIAAAAAAAKAAGGAPWQALEGVEDAVAAMVGVGYLLMRAAGFSRLAPHALGRLTTGLRRTASVQQGRQLEAWPTAASA